MQSSDKLGLSLELGSFAAGVMISTTDLAQHTLEQVIPCYYLIPFSFASQGVHLYSSKGNYKLVLGFIFLLLL